MIQEYKSKNIDYYVNREDMVEGEVEVFNLRNDFEEDGDYSFYLTSIKHWVTLEELKEIKKVVDKAIRESDKVF